MRGRLRALSVFAAGLSVMGCSATTIPQISTLTLPEPGQTRFVPSSTTIKGGLIFPAEADEGVRLRPFSGGQAMFFCDGVARSLLHVENGKADALRAEPARIQELMPNLAASSRRVELCGDEPAADPLFPRVASFFNDPLGRAAAR